MTQYVVLRYQKVFGEAKIENGAWVELRTVSARSARSAIQSVLDEEDHDSEGQFAAVPARSWKPVTVKVETKTALKFS